MRLGRKLGEGAGSEAYLCGEDRVVKLFAEGTHRMVVEYEAWVTSTAFAAGAPAPRVYGVVEIAGRRGIVLQRYEGRTLQEMAVAGEVTPAECGTIMARTAHVLHAAGYRASVRTFREWALACLRTLREQHVPDDVLDKVRAVLLTLPQSGVLCHGDLHAGNIIMTADGPKAIDWTSVISADALVDVARQHVTFTLVEPGVPPALVERWTKARRRADAAFIATYAQLSGIPPDDLRRAIAPYVVVMAAMRMLESGCTVSERQALLEYVRAAG